MKKVQPTLNPHRFIPLSNRDARFLIFLSALASLLLRPAGMALYSRQPRSYASLPRSIFQVPYAASPPTPESKRVAPAWRRPDKQGLTHLDLACFAVRIDSLLVPWVLGLVLCDMALERALTGQSCETRERDPGIRIAHTHLCYFLCDECHAITMSLC
jgi:hypothetical protein